MCRFPWRVVLQEALWLYSTTFPARRFQLFQDVPQIVRLFPATKCRLLYRQSVCQRSCRNQTKKFTPENHSSLQPGSDIPVMAKPLPVSPEHFYRRVLPEGCIEFSSPAGKQLFKEALSTGYMDCYFKLAAQFRTQDEPAFCGLSTLVMVLNALSIDPGRIWKGPWRWYHESMLDCCTSLPDAQVRGITFDQFSCLAECNFLLVKPVRATSSLSEEQFRDVVKRTTSQDDAVLVLSYSRSVLNQTGDGHFSPVGGYHAEKDLVLVLDTARFKYPSHWVPLSTLFAAMKKIDKESGKERGYILLSRHAHLNQLLLFRISPHLSVTLPQGLAADIANFLNQWMDWLGQDATNTPGKDDDESSIINKAVNKLIEMAQYLKEPSSILTSLVDVKCPNHVSQGHLCAAKRLLKSVEDQQVFQLVSMTIEEYLKTDSKELLYLVCKAAGQVECSGGNVKCCELQHLISPSHFFTTLLLSWPYRKLANRSTTNAALLQVFLEDTMGKMSDLLQNEVSALKQQLTIIMTVYNLETKCPCKQNDKKPTDMLGDSTFNPGKQPST